MKSESPSSRRWILSALADCRFTATVYRAVDRRIPERVRRAACLVRLVGDVVRRGGGDVCLELDSTLLAWDRQVLAASTAGLPPATTVRYEHARAAQEPLLAVADAVGWAWARGDDWRRRASPIVEEVVEVQAARSPSTTTVRKGLGLTSRR